MNNAYSEYKKHELNAKGEKTRKILDKYVISLYLSGISRVLKIKDA